MNISIYEARHWAIGFGSTSLLLGLGLLHGAQADSIYSPRTVLNKQPGEHLQVRYQGEVSQPSDLYLATPLQQQLFFFTENGEMSLQSRPFLRQEDGVIDRTLIDFSAETVPPGRYQVYQVLVRAGDDVFDTSAWLGDLHSLNFIVGEASTSSRDVNGDGFPDDDQDHDGFHDGDRDRDGYDDTSSQAQDSYEEGDDEYDEGSEEGDDEHDEHDEGSEEGESDEQESDAIGSDTGADVVINPASSAPMAAASGGYPDGARLLAAQCFQCHGTEGISVGGIESLREESNEIAEELFEMKYSGQLDDIMHRHAMGYSDAEIRSIAAYFSALYAQ